MQIYFDSEKSLATVSVNNLKNIESLMFIGLGQDIPKTDPSKINTWFPPEFLRKHRAYAIQEEEPFLLRIFTRNHESSNRDIRKKGGRKAMLMGQEVFGDTILACGHCGYHSYDGSNVRRHIRNKVCQKDKGYSEEDLRGLSRIERRKFLRRIATARCRARKKASLSTSCLSNIENSYDDEAVQENSFQSYLQDGEISLRNHNNINFLCQKNVPKIRKTVSCKALVLGPLVQNEIVLKVPYDVFILNEKNERIAWKPPYCPKASGETDNCQIVFKGARMKRRCLDLPLPLILTYRKLDCKTHHCSFTFFHPSARSAVAKDSSVKFSLNIKIFGETVMTRDFFHYFMSLLTVTKLKASQTARHLTGVWITILCERLNVASLPEEYRKLITLSKQTVKSIWGCIGEETGSKINIKLCKTQRKKRHMSKDIQQNTSVDTFSQDIGQPTLFRVVGNNSGDIYQNQCIINRDCAKLNGEMLTLQKSAATAVVQLKPPSGIAQVPPPQPMIANAPTWFNPVPHHPQYGTNVGQYGMTTQPAEYCSMTGHFIAHCTPTTLNSSS